MTVLASGMIGRCPLCKSEGVLHPASGLCVAGASCSDPTCILHIGYQDETNKHVRLEEWPSVSSGIELARSLIEPYTGDFGDLGAKEQMILDVGHALAGYR